MENDDLEKNKEKQDILDEHDDISEKHNMLDKHDDVSEKHNSSEVEKTAPKKKHNVPAIVLGFLMVAFAGVAIFFGIEYFKPKDNKCEQSCEINNAVSGNDEKNEEKTIYFQDMAEQYKEVYDVVTTVTSGVETDWDYIDAGGYMTYGMTYKPEGLNTYVPMRLVISKKIKNSNTGEKNVNVLKTKLEGAGFSSIGELPILGSAGPRIYGYEDSNKDVVCSAEEGNDGYNDFAVISCAKTDWSWLTDDEKNLISELETAYYDKTGRYPNVISDIENKIKNSQYSPYQTILVNVGGAAGLFYRTSPDAKWQFFVATQSALDCSDYNTDDLRKAFAGDVCYNGSTSLNQSTVQP